MGQAPQVIGNLSTLIRRVVGDMISAYEVSEATMLEILAELEKVAVNAERWARRSRLVASR